MTLPGTAMRYVETIRHLRAGMVIDRIVRRLRPKRLDRSPAGPIRAISGPWLEPVRRPVSLTGPSSLILLAQLGTLAVPGDWNDPARDRLWTYNLHYFDWLTGGGDDQWQRGSIAQWLAANPPAAGAGWEPYPIALRIVNWTKWLLAGNPPIPGMLDSLALQARVLAGALEFHLLGNHLLADAKALYFAGRLFAGSEATRWHETGRRLLFREWGDQVLADGGHDERSPMYHAILLEDVLDCINLARASGGDSALEAVAAPLAQRMLAWLAALTHPGGGILQFNDATPGVAATLGELLDYACALGLPAPGPLAPLTWLPATGYARAERGPAVLFADLAPVGPPHQPGHAHADTLGFELSLGVERALVNCGISTYNICAQRAWERSTAAHNCVAVSGQDSSDVWAAFRTGRRARVSGIAVSHDAQAIHLAGTHDGYRNLSGRPRHTRSWLLDANSLVITDTVSASAPQSAAAWFHLAPGLTPRIDDGEVHVSGARLSLLLATTSAVQITETERALGLNVRVPAFSLMVPLVGGRLTSTWSW